MVEILDERGRVFGLVNVVDLLVVLLVAVVVAGGFVVVLSESSPPAEETPNWTTRYTTVSTTVPIYSEVATLGPGAALSTAGGDVLRVTDVHGSFAANGSATLVFRASHKVRLEVPGDTLRVGDSLDLSTDRTAFSGVVLAANESSPDFETPTTSVTLSLNESTTSLRDVEPGDTATIGDDVVATIVATERGSQRGTRTVTAEVETWRHNGYRLIGTNVLRVGEPVTLVTDTTTVRGHVIEIGESTR